MKIKARELGDIAALLLSAVGAVVLAGCADAVLPEGSSALKKVKVVNEQPSKPLPDLSAYVRQRPSPKLFSLFRKPGTPPVVFDSIAASETCRDLQLAMKNMGYLHSDVRLETKQKNGATKAIFHLYPGDDFYLSSVDFTIRDDSIRELMLENPEIVNSLRPGMRFSVQELNSLRKNITSYLNDNGYYHFNKEYIEFEVDTTLYANRADVRLLLHEYSPDKMLHPRYKIGKVNYLDGDGGNGLNLRKSMLYSSTAFRSGDYYSKQRLQRTYNNFSRLQAVRYTNIKFTEIPDSNLLDCDILLSTNKPSTISFQPEGTNTAGDLGAAISLTYENRNIFHGSETFSVMMRGAFEAITGLEGYNDADYQEYGIETRLHFPRFVAPFLSSKLRRTLNATSELSVRYDLQNRPEFHRRVFSGAWRYRWQNAARNLSYRFDLLDMNYVYMPWISETFRHDYLESDDNRNAILRYNYENLFIMKIGFGLSRTARDYVLRTNVESAGNLLNALSGIVNYRKNADGQNSLFNIAYAQYVKGDIDYTRLFRIDENNQLALHAALGIAYPYGNSSILPFEKRYFSGGANSVRGWSVRSLGPGRFRGNDGRIDFINQTGDIKLDFSLEYRTLLFWKLNGAAFVDAGNIWTIRDYADQPGGQFRFSEFYKQIAAAYGLGVRLNFGYFIIRFDFGMKAVNPAYDTRREHFPILHPNLSRDLAFHFAVGMPF